MVAVRLSVAGWLVLSACSAGGGAPLRSPSLDYAPPPPTSADGDTIGADRRGPGDKLEEGASSRGPAPGWAAGKTGPTYNPKRRVGGEVEPPPASSSPSK